MKNLEKLKNKLKVAFASVAFVAGTVGGHRLYYDMYLNQTEPEQTQTAAVEHSYGLTMRERSCFTLSDFLKNPAQYRQQAGYQSLMTVFNSASLGRGMLEDVAKETPQMRFCDMELAPSIAAVHNPTRIGVDFDRHDNQAVYLTSIVHELAHHFHHLNDTKYFDFRRSLVDNQRAMLAMETAAPVVELLALLEAEQSGTLNWREKLDPSLSHYRLMGILTDRYQELRDTGYGHNAALNESARDMWHHVLQQAWRLDFYNQMAVRFAVLQADRLEGEARYFNYHDPVVDHTVIKSGKIGAYLDFTRLEEMPSSDQLFGGNNEMRQIFAAVEWYRSSLMLGADHIRVVADKQKLIKAGNPFVHVDFDWIAEQLHQGTDVQEAFNSAIENPQISTPMADFGLTAPVRQALQSWGTDIKSDMAASYASPTGQAPRARLRALA